MMLLVDIETHVGTEVKCRDQYMVTLGAEDVRDRLLKEMPLGVDVDLDLWDLGTVYLRKGNLEVEIVMRDVKFGMDNLFKDISVRVSEE